MSVEFYGFAIYVATYFFSAVWLCWAFIPDSYLEFAGIIYYPSKYWAAATPAILIMAYATWFILHTISLLIFCRPNQQLASCSDIHFRKVKEASTLNYVPFLEDMSIQEINELKYGK